jgi:AraC-like DNA-binding protein
MNISLHKPKNKHLAKYIRYFYFFDRNENDAEITYFGFPTNNVFLMIVRNAVCRIDQSNVTIEGVDDDSINTFLFFDDKAPGFLNYKKQVQEITICFKPLGINNFIKNPFSTYLQGAISNFLELESNKLAHIFGEACIDEKLEALELFLFNKIVHFEHPFLDEIIKNIKQNPQLKITQIAKDYNISRTTLNKHFQNHIGTSASHFAKIVRFRKAIALYTAQTPKNLLVDVAFASDYFDQSHMAKDFQSMTGHSPKSFFANLTQFENGQINWIFES